MKNGGRRRHAQAAPAEANETPATDREQAAPNSAPAGAKAACVSGCGGCTSCGASQSVGRIVKEKKAGGTAGPLTVLAGALASSAVFGFRSSALSCPVGLTFALVIALSRLFQFNEAGWSVVIFAAFLVVELLVLRRWCANFCPLGALIGLMSRLNRTFVPRLNPKACVHVTHGVDCRICLDACPEGIDLRQGPLTSAQISLCIKCGACAHACPSAAVNFPWLKNSPFAAAAPVPERGTQVVADAAERVKNYDEVAPILPIEEAVRQSSRYLRCGRCTEVCPQGNPVSEWMAHLSQGDVRTASQLMLREGAMPEICGRICPSERFCEQVCSMQEAHGAVMIPAIERSVAQYALDQGFAPGIRRARRPVRAAVIGAGPAGMACADYLARRGVTVTVYEAEQRIGGLLTYGIAPFKLDRAVVAKRAGILRNLGVTVVTGTKVGRDIAFDR